MGRKLVAVDINSRIPASAQVRSFQRRVLTWFERHGRDFAWRRESATLYERIVSEALLQRTRAETVHAFYRQFFRRFPSWASLAGASREELEQQLRHVGLWKRRAVSLGNLARELARRRGRFSPSRDEIEELPGVGQYVANAIQLFAHGQAEPLLDANMARVLERHFGARDLADIRYDPYLQKLAKVVIPRDRAIAMNWAILDLAATICRIQSPRCDRCPVSRTCMEYRARRGSAAGRYFSTRVSKRPGRHTKAEQESVRQPQ